ncbi:MAG: hypothetical protein Ct9H90mP20_4450 [Candidatus Neomarinimicrobiota bacterium]|nr:MAG: hypothetical protein Ct9H90mP20_4450 [Candidatus Neomarinimicrobiota bacterium]
MNLVKVCLIGHQGRERQMEFGHLIGIGGGENNGFQPYSYQNTKFDFPKF